MNLPRARALAVIFALVAQAAAADELLERVVVRNRLYSMDGRFEVSPTISLSVVNQLVDTMNFRLGLAYNVTDTIGFEALGGYAYSHHSGLADQIALHLTQRNPFPPSNDTTITNDFTGLWEIKGNAVGGIRWAPVYGKINLLADVPVHFQAYLWLGAGAGGFKRQSVVYCQELGSRADGTCNSWKVDTKVSWIATAALGFRFFLYQGGAIRLELRDYAFPDSYLVDINRTLAETGQATGTSKSAGLTHLVSFDFGYSFLF